MLLQSEQTQIRQLLYELPDHGLLCLLMEICDIITPCIKIDKPLVVYRFSETL